MFSELGRGLFAFRVGERSVLSSVLGETWIAFLFRERLELLSWLGREMGCFPCKGETWVAFLVRERLGLLSWLGRGLVCFPCKGKACVAFRVRERLVCFPG